MPAFHPFTTVVQSAIFLSSTTDADDPTVAWAVFFDIGVVDTFNKANTNFVWCVRGSQAGPDEY